MRILSIQSHVVDGHVGNAAAVFPMQRLGAEVLPVHTLQFSNHPGEGAFGGDVFSADHLARVLAGLEARDVPDRLDAVLSGYLGTAENAAVLADAVMRWKRRNPQLVYACDPVIGDTDKGVYVRPELAAMIGDTLLPLADVVFPNAFELEHLSGIAPQTEAGAARSIAALHARGPGLVFATSLALAGAGQITTAVSQRGALHLAHQPRFSGAFSGTGDCFSGMALVHWLGSGDARLALTRATAAMAAILAETVARGQGSLALVAAQDSIR